MSHLFLHEKGRYLQNQNGGFKFHSDEAIEALKGSIAYVKVHGECGALYVDPESLEVQGYFRRDSKGKPMPEQNRPLFDGSFKQPNGSTYSF